MRFSKSYRGIVAALAAVFAFPAPAAAQNGTVTGTVVESPSGRPLPAVSVTLRVPGDTSAVAGSSTDAAGRFRIVAAPGTYTLQASRLGYGTARRPGVTITAGGSADLGNVQLATATLLLEEVQVVTEAATAIVAADRTIYSTRDMPVASGGMATDVLRSVPELEVDVNGGVQLRGTAAQIYLNGRPAPMQGESLELFLQQFPADRIDRVEVIPNPSARFEAEGAGGIVNIVLKKNVDLGLSGSVFANTSSRGEIGSGGRLTYQRGRLTLFGGGFLRRSDRRTSNYDLRRNLVTDPVTLLETDGWNDREGLSGNLDLTTEWKLTERSTFYGSAGMWRNGFDADGLTAYTQLTADSTPTLRYDRGMVNENTRLSADFGTGIRRLVFGPASPELTGEWEFKLRQMEQGRVKRDDFMKEVIAQTVGIVERVKGFEEDESNSRTTDIVSKVADGSADVFAHHTAINSKGFRSLQERCGVPLADLAEALGTPDVDLVVQCYTMGEASGAAVERILGMELGGVTVMVDGDSFTGGVNGAILVVMLWRRHQQQGNRAHIGLEFLEVGDDFIRGSSNADIVSGGTGDGFGATVALIWTPRYDQRGEARYASARNSAARRSRRCSPSWSSCRARSPSWASRIMSSASSRSLAGTKSVWPASVSSTWIEPSRPTRAAVPWSPSTA